MIDNPSQTVQIDKPKQVDIAVGLLSIFLILSFFRGFQELGRISNEASSDSTGIIFIGLLGSFILYLFLIVKTSKGKNWARFILLVLFAINAPLLIYGIKNDFSSVSNPISGIVGEILLGLMLISIFCLFTPASNAWFKYMRRRTI